MPVQSLSYSNVWKSSGPKFATKARDNPSQTEAVAENGRASG